jgi:asparagine synthetase B (glutamine-hydrolysing)
MYGNVDDATLDRMLSCTTHRGPGEAGSHVDHDNDLTMRIRRLSIVDLADGSQPT